MVNIVEPHKRYFHRDEKVIGISPWPYLVSPSVDHLKVHIVPKVFNSMFDFCIYSFHATVAMFHYQEFQNLIEKNLFLSMLEISIAWAIIEHIQCNHCTHCGLSIPV